MVMPVIFAAASDILWVVQVEIIKIIIGLTVGAILLYTRESIIEAYRNMKKFITAAKSGITFLGSPDFQNVPKAIADLTKRIERIEKFVGPNGGASILDGIRQLKEGQDTLQLGIESVAVKDREIADAAGILMWKSDADGNCTWASTALQRLVGYGFDEGFAGQQWENLYFPEDYPTVQRRWEEAVEAAKNSRDPGLRRADDVVLLLSMRTRYRHGKTGKAIPIYFKATRMPDGTIMGVVTDLSVYDEIAKMGCDLPVCPETGEPHDSARVTCATCVHSTIHRK